MLLEICGKNTLLNNIPQNTNDTLICCQDSYNTFCHHPTLDKKKTSTAGEQKHATHESLVRDTLTLVE
jgi:hypothetical protein